VPQLVRTGAGSAPAHWFRRAGRPGSARTPASLWVLPALLALGTVASADQMRAAPAHPGDVVQAGCVVHLGEADGHGVAEVSADCRWPVAPQHVAGILRDHGSMSEVMSSLSASRVLSDGRVVQVHSTGPMAAERQVTMRFHAHPLEDGGLRLDFGLAREQQPVREGHVQVEVNDGWWEIRSDGFGGTRLRYALRYDAGGRLEPWIVRRFQKAGVARSMRELRQAAERAAELAALTAPEAAGSIRSVSAPPPAGAPGAADPGAGVVSSSDRR